jgi:hypothetical protein
MSNLMTISGFAIAHIGIGKASTSLCVTKPREADVLGLRVTKVIPCMRFLQRLSFYFCLMRMPSVDTIGHFSSTHSWMLGQIPSLDK